MICMVTLHKLDEIHISHGKTHGCRIAELNLSYTLKASMPWDKDSYMSKEYLKRVFSGLAACNDCMLEVVQVVSKNDESVSYVCREIRIKQEDRVRSFIRELADYNCSPKGIDGIDSVEEYSGCFVKNCISKMEGNNLLIHDACELLIRGSADPNRDVDLSVLEKYDAMLLRCTVIIDGNNVCVIMVSMQKPISVFRRNQLIFSHVNTFSQFDEPVLTLRNKMDVVIVNNTIYFLPADGERLFDMERTHKILCNRIVEEIVTCDFLSDVDSFTQFAGSGQNPRRFVSYNRSHFEALQDARRRKSLGKKFNIKLIDGKIDTSNKGNVERLIKFLCNKAMVDPCDKDPVEVSSSKPWH